MKKIEHVENFEITKNYNSRENILDKNLSLFNNIIQKKEETKVNSFNFSFISNNSLNDFFSYCESSQNFV